MAITPNYGWVTPAPTDYLVDLPADFETFADAVDADLAGLLGGTTGQYLVKDSNADHDFSWGTISAGGLTQIETGTLTGASVTTGTIPNTYKELFIVLTDALPANDGAEANIRFNGNSGTVYYQTSSNSLGSTAFDRTRGQISQSMDNAVTENLIVGRIPDYANATTWKFIAVKSMVVNNSTTTNFGWLNGHVLFGSTAAISSITFLPDSGNWTSGTYTIYGVS